MHFVRENVVGFNIPVQNLVVVEVDQCIKHVLDQLWKEWRLLGETYVNSVESWQ